MQIWLSILNFLNLYGGLISAISLILSIIISIITGTIKKSIIQIRQYKEYKPEKKAAVKHLEELVASIELDELYDNAMKAELLIEINKLLKYKGFIDFHCKYYIFRINWILKSTSIKEGNANKLISLIAKLCGRMSVDPVNKEMR